MLTARAAVPGDAAAIARIYDEGIADRIATFETAPRTAEDVLAWFARPYPIVVVEEGSDVVAFASASPSSPRQCYAGNAEFSVYVARAARGRGAGRVAMDALVAAARERKLSKLLSLVFTENTASRALLARVGFREVGVYRKHGCLDGTWHDVVIVELLL